MLGFNSRDSLRFGVEGIDVCMQGVKCLGQVRVYMVPDRRV